MANLDNSEVVKQLKQYLDTQKVSDYVIECCKQPSYLSSFLIDENKNTDVILVYKKQEAALFGDETAAIIANASLLDKSQDDISLAGNPLETSLNVTGIKLEDFTINESLVHFKKKDSHHPISSIIAMKILNYANMNLKPNIPIWILHDSSDLQNSILLGSTYNDKWFTRSWVTLQGRLENDVTIEEMLKKHESFNKIKSRLVTEVSCKYCLQDKYEAGSIFVHANWSKPSYQMPSHGATMFLEFNSKVGDSKSILKPLWEQLLLLQKYYDILCQWKKTQYPLRHQQAEISLPTSKGIFDTNDNDVNLSDRIIDALMSPHYWGTEYRNVSSSYKEVLNSIKKGETCGMDLTGRLWILLSMCSTYEELTTNMALVYQQVKKCQVEPYVNMLNKSKLAEAIKILLGDKSANPQIMLEPLEVLIEIGVEKLINDYVAVFTQSEVVKEEILNIPTFLGFSSMDSATWLETISTCFIWMSKIHAVSELVSLALTGIEVTPNITTIIKRILNHYLNPLASPVNSLKHLCDNPHLQFITPINIISFRSKNIWDMPYEKWLMKLMTKSENVSVTNWFLRASVSPFPDSVCLGVNDTIISEDVCDNSTVNKPHYFCAQMTTFSTRIGK